MHLLCVPDTYGMSVGGYLLLEYSVLVCWASNIQVKIVNYRANGFLTNYFEGVDKREDFVKARSTGVK